VAAITPLRTRISPVHNTIATETDVEHFARHGFVSLDRPIVTQSGLAEVQRLLDGVFNNFEHLPEKWRSELGRGTAGARIHEVQYTAKLVPELRETEVFLTIERLARELLQVETVQLHFDHAIFKPGPSSAPTAWHQDVHFDPDFDCPMTTMWIPLQSVDTNNGCMEFVPTSIWNDVLPHERVGVNGKGIVNPPIAQKVTCPLPLGGLTVHNARAIHGSGPNLSDSTRRAWIVKFVEDHRSPGRRAMAAAKNGRHWAKIMGQPLQQRFQSDFDLRY
jgi:Phytanoyl-CoA dioxygenase (PhyH)